MAALEVRPYVPADREALLDIAADTAFFGEPVEAMLEDRRLFLQAVYAYYPDLEPEHAWVATADGEVVGFLVGAVDTRRKAHRLVRHILPRIVVGLLLGRYRLGPRGWRYVAAQLGAALRREAPQVNVERYPAHLHVNVAAPWRGRGLGRALLEAYLTQLRRLGVPGVHLLTTTSNTAAVHLYEDLGFRRLDARATRMWRHLLDAPVLNVAYGLRLPHGA